MKRTTVALTLVSIILFSIVTGILLADLEGTEEEVEEETEAPIGKLYTYPLSAGGENYIITSRTN